MKLIKPSYEIFEQGFEEQDIYKQIEKVGRTCYKSEDKINEGSAKPFVERMENSKHYAMLEHGTIYLSIPYDDIIAYVDPQTPYDRDILCNPWTKYVVDYGNGMVHISSNYRWMVENGLQDWLKYISEPNEYHERRICVKFTCDRGVSHEFVRHRVFSFAQESTRYCNYSKDKFSNEVTYICPCWLDYDKVQELTEIANKDNKEVYRMGHDESLSMEERGLCSFVYDMSNHEHGYLFQISAGWKAQEARAILPNALKTDLVMTGFVSDWKHFFDLRAYGVTGKPHPQASELAIPLLNEFIEKGYLHGTR
jgi:thymidylate synthase (FAD)